MLIAVLTDPAVGGTFLEWSLHYLAGHKKYYYAQGNQWLDLPSDPVTNKNAHGFLPNHPETLELFNLIHSNLITTQTDQFHSIYFHNFNHTTTSFDKNVETAISNLNTKKVIVLTTSSQHHLYHWAYHMRSSRTPSWADPTGFNYNSADHLDDFVQHFFKESSSRWEQENLNNIWDRREFLALNLKPKLVLSILPNINLVNEHYIIDTAELYNTFDVTVNSLFAYLEIEMDSARKKAWQLIYYKWRQIHYNRMLFSWYFDRIINNIILGNNQDLTRFNLDLIQEAIIQHELIYKHNLNLKTWQLEKFTNTNQLHRLLEPNTHDLSEIKNSIITSQ